MNHVAPPPERLLRAAEVREHLNISKTTLYRWLQEKRFPEPIRYSETCLRWRQSDIDAWIASKASAA